MVPLIIFMRFFLGFTTVSGMCFFPAEYQGIFSSQVVYNVDGVFRYSEITVLPDAIPIWGKCWLRNEDAVILSDRTGGQDCMRCFRMFLRSPNVLQVYTEGLDRCYDNEHSAISSCPTQQEIETKRAREIVLYKSRSFRQDGRISRVMCPFVGRYHFSYNAYNGRRRTDTCVDLSSQVSSCPRASQLKFFFRDCTFGDLDLRLECLGSWTGFNGHRYLALFDPDATTEKQPKYRCAMYVEDPRGGVALSLSVDSSCHRQLRSPWQGFETLLLTPVKPPSPPAAVYSSSCVFPNWAQGKWQDIQISGNGFVYRDEEKDLSHSGICISADDSETNEERFAIYTLTQCGMEAFACLWLKERSRNVMEFILGSAEDRFNASSLCAKDRLRNHGWMTQGREEKYIYECPLKGAYAGVLPDDRTLCANLASDCSKPDQMKYTISPCNNSNVHYEERYYECLGQWEEAGITYTYTYRKDVNKYECFAGVEVSTQEAYIIEGGFTCTRGLQPLAKGMKIIRRDECLESNNIILDVSNSIEGRSDRRIGRKTPPWRTLRGGVASFRSSLAVRSIADFRLYLGILCYPFFMYFSMS